MKAARTRTIATGKQVSLNARRLAFGLLCIVLLGGMPLVSSAQTLEWSPWTMDFGEVPLGETAYRTLTLTNADAGATITVSSVEFTYNVFGQFGYETSLPMPAILAPGGSMDVVFSFTPVEVSFQQADVMITSTSLNAPSLYYMLSGLGTINDMCYPLDSCGGLCVDLQTDLQNCGSCGNACGPVSNGTAACEAGQCTITCDEGYEQVGNDCEPIVATTPLEMMQDLIAYANASIEDGTLEGFWPRNTEWRGLIWFMWRLNEAERLLSEGSYDQACGMLRRAQLRTDGGYPFTFPIDHVVGEASYVINDSLLEVMAAMDNCEPREPYTLRRRR